MSGVNYDKLKQRRSGARQSSGWKPKDGENRVRVLPPHSSIIGAWETMEDIAVSYKIHYFKLEGRPTEVSLCLNEQGQPCPACETWRAWRRSEDPGMKEMARQISPSDKYMLNILDVNNLQAGVQHWGANYTCWDKILEIAANPAWGNVLDPGPGGVDFIVNLTPASKSRTGFNSYSVMPVPDRTSVLDTLAQDPEWKAKVDSLADESADMKTADEIYALLEEIGFPPPPGRANPAPVPAAAAAPPVAAQTAPPVAAQPAPPTPPVAPPAAAPVGATASPPPVEPDPPAAATAPAGVHYDPGPNYEPKTPIEQIPAGAPRCFGDYNPDVHSCASCPQMTECQMKLLGIA